MQRERERERGFTLIELSVVLVIIGLITGCILFAKDMIEAAKMRQQISQLENFSTAVNTFKLKYNSLPGDILVSKAASFSLPANGSWIPNDDGLFNCSYDTNCQIMYLAFRDEHQNFWAQLSAASLVDGAYSIGGWGGGGANYRIGTYMPAMKLNPNNGIVPLTVGGAGGLQNWWMLGVGDSDFGNDQLPSSLTPMQAYALDKKMDDGIPTGGIVRKFKMPLDVVNGVPYTGLDTANDDNVASGYYIPTNCVSNGGTAYNVSNTNLACYLAVRMQ